MSVRTEGCNTSRVTAFGPDTHPSYLHLTSSQQQHENQTAYVVNDTVWKSECEESFGNLLCCKSLKLDNKLPFATDFAQRNTRLKVTVLSPFR